MPDFRQDLNPAQLKAVTAPGGPVLVIAGAGTGKTRTIVYRLAHLADQGVPPERILLLTFTRRAARDMARRAGELLGGGLDSVRGGTFHSFAALVLRKNCGLLGYRDGFSILDPSDAQDILYHARRRLGLGKAGRSFPKNAAILALVSAARNREIQLSDLLDEEPHLKPYRDELLAIGEAFADRKRQMGLMDYDDLLFNLDRLLAGNEAFRERMRRYVLHVLVDEYQDTNLVQARIVGHLTGEGGNVMAVGDDAQSIYAFRGANLRNILDFPKQFPSASVIRLERNYRSTQPILDLANGVLRGARERYDKNLFTTRADGPEPAVHRPSGDLAQARAVVARVREYARAYPLHEIAVLFRAGYESYQVEIALGKEGIRFQKFGGLRFTESSHIKDAVALLRLVADGRDRAAWLRAAAFVSGTGGRAAERLADAILADDPQATAMPEIQNLLVFLHGMRALASPSPVALLNAVLEFYSPILAARHPEDLPVRQAALDQFAQIARGYATLDLLLADVGLDANAREDDAPKENALVLSTVHSAKGLEWPAVLVIDLVEGCFPSRHALESPEEMEEERRLLYVACTRARDRLDLFIPKTLYNRTRQQAEPAVPCPFLPGRLAEAPDRPARPRSRRQSASPSFAPSPTRDLPAHCTHKLFGRGKVVQFIAPDKYKVVFPSFGQKIILACFLSLDP